MKITFHGGAKSVTGSNYLLEFGDTKLLIDCGLFQGSKFAEDLNYEKFPYNPAEIQAVFITHSHTDHMGRLPKLIKEGFKGQIYLTEPADAIIRAALPNNLSLLTDEAERHKHTPLFSEQDLKTTFQLLHPVKYYEEIKISDDVSVTLHNAGHILGSSIIEINHKNMKVYFTGDLGNPPMPLLPSPDAITDADYVITESAYGDRLHENKEQRKNLLEKTIKETIARDGVLMIPSFAIERTQELLFELNELVEHNKIPKIPIFIDSPLAIKVTEAYKKFPNYFNDDTRGIIKSGDDIFKFPGLKMTMSTTESMAINDVNPPKIIIAGSGMSMGGRILHHEKRYLNDENSTILFVGYQVENSLGRRILNGDKEVRIHGKRIQVRCHIVQIDGYSAHADQNQLSSWINKTNTDKKLKKVFIVQGEDDASQALATRLKEDFFIDAIVPDQGEDFELE